MDNLILWILTAYIRNNSGMQKFQLKRIDALY